jgi:hypothetical protein
MAARCSTSLSVNHTGITNQLRNTVAGVLGYRTTQCTTRDAATIIETLCIKNASLDGPVVRQCSSSVVCDFPKSMSCKLLDNANVCSSHLQRPKHNLQQRSCAVTIRLPSLAFPLLLQRPQAACLLSLAWWPLLDARMIWRPSTDRPAC